MTPTYMNARSNTSMSARRANRSRKRPYKKAVATTPTPASEAAASGSPKPSAPMAASEAIVWTARVARLPAPDCSASQASWPARRATAATSAMDTATTLPCTRPGDAHSAATRISAALPTPTPKPRQPSTSTASKSPPFSPMGLAGASQTSSQEYEVSIAVPLPARNLYTSGKIRLKA